MVLFRKFYASWMLKAEVWWNFTLSAWTPLFSIFFLQFALWLTQWMNIAFLVFFQYKVSRCGFPEVLCFTWWTNKIFELIKIFLQNFHATIVWFRSTDYKFILTLKYFSFGFEAVFLDAISNIFKVDTIKPFRLK